TEKEFGSAESRIKVSKPLMVKSALPRFTRTGDRFTAGAVVINYSSSPVSAVVAMSVAGAVVSSSAEVRVLALDPGTGKRADWSFSAVSTGAATFIFTARAGAETDGEKAEIMSVFGELPETSAVSMAVRQVFVQTVTRPPLAASADVEIALSPSVLSKLGGAALYLARYPYTCLEQKVSKVYPVLLNAEFAADFLPSDTGVLKADADKLFSSLGDYAGPGGGFCYWRNGSYSDPWLTAYVLEAVPLARKNGFRVDEDAVKAAAAFLDKYVSGGGSYADDLNIRAQALYALVLNKLERPDVFTKLYAARGKMSAAGLAYLLRGSAKLNLRADKGAELSRMLYNRLRLSGETSFFEDTGGNAWTHPSGVKTTALSLQALMEANGTYPAIESTVRWLVQMQKNGCWNNTSDTAAALRALEYYYASVEEGRGDFSAEVSVLTVPEKILMKQDFTDLEPPSVFQKFSITDITGSSASAKVRFSKDGAGVLYCTMRLNTVPKAYPEPLARGFSLRRSLAPVAGGGLKAGGRAEITLTVNTAQDRYFVALEDFIPSGFEIVNEGIAAETGAADGDSDSDGYDYGSGFTHVEKYDDRLVAFADYLPAGEHQYKYLVQAVAPGNFTRPAGRVSCMYEPEVFGRTATENVVIK
ncbi:MAG: alpha-2-macroglobulin family protein, partial [Elusimicrobiaceae bacterium]